MKHLLLLILLALPASAWAASGKAGGFSVAPSILYSTTNMDLTEIGSGEVESTSTYYDLNLGYTWGNGLYVGAIYGARTSGNGTTDTTDTYMGASVGYSNNGWIAVLHYLVSAEDELSATVKLIEGSGFGADLGYMWSVSNWFSIGMALNYRSLSYKKYDNGTTEVEADTSESSMLPFLLLGFSF